LFSTFDFYLFKFTFFLFLPLFKKVVQNIFGTIFSIFITLPIFKNVVAKHLAPPFPKVD
jgi:hypothetical protein